MAEFYKKNDAGEFVEADADVDALFRSKSDEIVRKKLGKAKEQATAEIRAEIEDEVRKSASDTLKAEAKSEVEAEYKDKLAAVEKRANDLDVALRRKTIAAEYGFKPEAEQFLGDGDDDDMRSRADTLKSSFGGVAAVPDVEKGQSEPTSRIQRETGIKVVI